MRNEHFHKIITHKKKNWMTETIAVKEGTFELETSNQKTDSKTTELMAYTKKKHHI